ncbi:sulfur carrier protein ThiS [Flavobacteriaceae bacterium R38]|nr:sulfur carrier protein ThiS [Flavobacteriaceae bacterium R38]
MTISINNKQKNIQDTISLENLLESIDISPKGIAIALNNMVISKKDWKVTFLKEKDQVTIIQATQGG